MKKNKEDFISYIEDPNKRENFILKLKQLDENSDIFQIHGVKIINKLNVKKIPKGVFQKTALQNVFQFCDIFACFSQFRLVCKAWKNAIETIRFSGYSEENIIRSLVKKYPDTKYPPVFAKCFHSLQKLNLSQDLDEVNEVNLNNAWPFIQKFILQHTSNLTHISTVDAPQCLVVDSNLKLFHCLLHKHKKTLLHIVAIFHENIFPANIKFSKLKELILYFDFTQDFEHGGEIIEQVSTCEKLEIIQVIVESSLLPIPQRFVDYILANHANRCLSNKNYELFDYFPSKIYEGCDIKELCETRYGPDVEYIFFTIGSPKVLNAMKSEDWQKYREYFKPLKNLKGVGIDNPGEWLCLKEEIIGKKQNQLLNLGITSKALTQLKQFALYLQNELNVEILDDPDLCENLSKKMNVWRFEFKIW